LQREQVERREGRKGKRRRKKEQERRERGEERERRGEEREGEGEGEKEEDVEPDGKRRGGDGAGGGPRGGIPRNVCCLFSLPPLSLLCPSRHCCLDLCPFF